jgi:hypothetical protein
MIFKAPKITGFRTTELPLPTVEQLQAGPCGIHRGTYGDVLEHFPELAAVIRCSPIPLLGDYEYDVKIHMLFKGMYPCIPNWHCDNVPRGDDGKLDYSKVDPNADPMFLWVSGKPTTEFMGPGFQFEYAPKDHGDLDRHMKADPLKDHNFKIPSNEWVQMDQLTPHRGTAETEDCWRIFIRATPKSIAPSRPVVSVVRRHAQVYLPHDFHW